MADTVDLSAEFEAPAKVAAADAPTSTSNESVDLMTEFQAPPKQEEHAIINDAADKMHQWKTADAGGRLKLLVQNFGEHFTEETTKTLEQSWHDINTPMVSLPRAGETTPEEREKYPAQPIISGAYNGAAKIAEGLTTPLNVGTLGMFGALSKVAQGIGPAATAAKHALTLIKAAFAGEMARGAGGAAGEASVTAGKSAQQQTESIVEALGSSAMAALAAHSAGADLMEPSGRSPAKNPNAVEDAIGRQTDANIAKANETLDKPAPVEPVDIGPRDETVSTGTGVPTPKEVEILAEQKRLIDEHLAAQAKEAGKPVLAEELTPPAAGTEEHAAITEELTPPKEPAPSAEPLPDTPPAEGVTGMRNAIVDQERVDRGLPPAMEEAARGFGEVWGKAMKAIESDPEAPKRLVDELNEKPRPITDMEDALLTHRQVDLQNQFDKLAESVVEGDEGQTAESLAADKLRLAQVSDDLLDTYNADKAGGRETARGLSARRILVNEDFSLAKMITRERVSRDNKPLTDAQTAEVKALHEKITATQKAFDDYVAANKPRRGTHNTDKNIISKFIDEQADAARQRIKERLTGARTSASVMGADLLADYAIIGAQHIKNGIVNSVEFSKRMVDEFGDVIRPHLDAIFEKAKEKASAAAAEAEEAKLTTAIEARKKRLEARIAELKKKVESGDTSHSPEKANRPSVEEIETLQQQRDALSDDLARMRAAEAKITELQEAIAEKERKISEGDLSPKPTDVNRPSAPAIEKLKQERDALNKELADARKEDRKPDDIEIQARKLEEMQKRIAAKKAAIQSGNTAAKRGEVNRPKAPGLEEAQQELDALNKEIAKTRTPEPVVGEEKMTPEERRLKAYKTRAEKAAAEYDRRTAAGDFSPRDKPDPIKLDPEGEKLKAEAERAKFEFQTRMIQNRLNNRTTFEKVQDTLVKWRRGFLLSGPGTLVKLTAAAVNRIVQTPTEEAIGAVIGKVIPGVAERAPRQGGINSQAEAAAISGAFFRGLQDASTTLKTGHSDLDILYGKGSGKNVRESDVVPRSVIDFFGSLHGALKAPVKRAEFERAFEKRMAHAIRNGADGTDPLVQTKIAVDAYKDANRAIFMQDNVVTDAWNAGISRLTKANKAGEVSNAGKMTATAMKVLLPIVKVPTNIVAETFETATGLVTGSARLALAIRKGTENLTPEQADIIMRQLKKGSLGAALLALGYFNPENAGGYYTHGDKRKPRDVKAGHIMLYGVDIPPLLTHNPAAEVLQMGATIRRVADAKIKGKEKGLSTGIPSALLGLLEEVPFIRTPIEMGKLIPEHTRTRAAGDTARSFVVPELVQATARFLDKDKDGNPIRRDPKTVIENIETGIPGLRETVKKK